MQNLKFLRNYPMDLGLMLKIIAAGILGGIIAVLVVQIGLALGAISPDDEYRMNEVIGLTIMGCAVIAAVIALHYRKHE